MKRIAPLQEMDRAPDFVLKTKTAEGLKDIRLWDNLRKKQTILLFFPMAFTSGCTKELCAASEDYSQYAKLDADVYGISADNPFAQEAWAKASNITITLLSDMGSKVIEDYGVLAPSRFGFPGVAMRSVFVINKIGTIVYRWVGKELSDLPDFEPVKQALGRPQFL